MELDCCGTCCFYWILKRAELDLEFQMKHSLRGWEFAKTAIFWLLKSCEGDDLEAGQMRDYHHCRRNCLHRFWKIFTFLTDTFEAFKLRDMDIASKLLYCAYNLILKSGSAQMNTLEVSWLLQHVSSKRVTENDFRQLMKVTYRNEEVRHALTRVVWIMVQKGNVFFLQNLLRYGLMCLPPSSVCKKRRNQFFQALYYLTFQDDSSLPSGGVRNPLTKRRTFHVLRAVELLALELKERQLGPGGTVWYLRQPRLRRDRITFDPESPRFKCLRMVFDSIPEPFITTKELRIVLELAHANRCDSQTKVSIDAIVSGFKMMLPESEGSVTPRSLKHLSRCQLRDNLRQTGALPHGIHELELPSCIQAYVLLEQ